MQPTPPHPVTLTDRARAAAASTLTSVATALHRLGVHPDMLTAAGLAFVFVAAVLIANGSFTAAVIVLVLGLPLDALDGAVARVMQRKNRFGALLDSTLDRYADAFIFVSLGYYFANHGSADLLLVSAAALIGSYGVSYVRARAEGLGVDVKIGLFSRLERLAVIIVCLLIPVLMPYGLWLLAIGTNFTTLQRLWYVYRVLHNREVS
jgi:CDP-diacylglycerol--glycerol-3-phosphate 3-phosphatidyltransferase